MHEYSIVGALIEQVAREADARGARVHRLHVAIGELAGVDVELLRTAYDTFRPATVCADAELDVRAVAADWRCPGCGRSFRRGMRLQCSDCGRPARLAGGDEIVLERIELEVPEMEAPHVH
ncbi:MAG: hydrogenase maturation nickel metallochaperone HypA [Deltaproteobacteria bacterium]|nr:hydrogenase maturation nickel metallochaperone HypA [Kofleriaceae bacterium]